VVSYKAAGGTDGENATITMAIVTAAGDHETEIFILPIGPDEPVSLSEAKAQVRMANDDSEDAFIASLIMPARAYVERVGRYFLVAATRTERFGAFGDFIEIYRRPIASIDGVFYGPTGDDTDTEYAGAVAPVGRFPLRIYPAADNSFPDLNDGEVVTVNYTSGSVSPTSEEYLIAKRAILLLIGHWFEYREAAQAGIVSPEIALSVSSLLDELRPVSAY
jgi:uncharacterized phiE125 gp8 family phage protein